MALTPYALELIAPLLHGANVLCLGYPDLLCTPGDVFRKTGVTVLKTTTFGSGHKKKYGLAETEETFAALGAAHVLCVDVKPSRGVEQLVDLNEPTPQWDATFDLVIDAGTIEHCANIGQALRNAASAVKPRGHIFHSPPMSMVNHGFYNVSPTLLHDFYEQNGWHILHLSAFMKSTFERFEIDPTARFKAPPEAALYFLARRDTSAGLVWPTQTKYKDG